jgi:hypothetical protein
VFNQLAISFEHDAFSGSVVAQGFNFRAVVIVAERAVRIRVVDVNLNPGEADFLLAANSTGTLGVRRERQW